MISPNTTRVDLPSGARAHARRSFPNSSPSATKRLSLALQGGGAFGAFTWGVLDRLLEADTVTFDAVSGASAGAMNAVLLASGLAQGGPEEARVSLERFWREVSKQGKRMKVCNPIAEAFRGGHRCGNPVEPSNRRGLMAECRPILGIDRLHAFALGQQGWSTEPPGFVEPGPTRYGAAALAVSVQPL